MITMIKVSFLKKKRCPVVRGNRLDENYEAINVCNYVLMDQTWHSNRRAQATGTQYSQKRCGWPEESTLITEYMASGEMLDKSRTFWGSVSRTCTE